MSPTHKQKLLIQLWQKDKVFDTILALTLPCELISMLVKLLAKTTDYLNCIHSKSNESGCDVKVSKCVLYSDPDIEDALLSNQVNTVAEALLKLDIKPLKLDGE